jgi:hypothetical protein
MRHTMLIRAFGQFWNPHTVEWGKQGPGNKGELPGKVRRNGSTYEIDFWRVKAVYVLRREGRLNYLGAKT